MRAIIIVILPFLVIGAFVAFTLRDRPELKVCEDELLAELRSPATYERVKASTTRIDQSLLKETDSRLPHATVHITYDAANAYGTPIRGEHFCYFQMRGNSVDPSRRLTLEDIVGPISD